MRYSVAVFCPEATCAIRPRRPEMVRLVEHVPRRVPPRDLLPAKVNILAVRILAEGGKLQRDELPMRWTGMRTG